MKAELPSPDRPVAQSAGTTFVLLYHAIDSPEEIYTAADAADRGLAVERASLSGQLRCLADLRRRVVPLHALFSEPASPERVILTFDDGHKSNHSLALPELAAAGAVATFYVIAGKVDRDAEYMTSGQLRDLVRHGMSIGSHTLTHPFLPHLDRAGIVRELLDSKRLLEEMVGVSVLDLALPGGHGSRAVLEIARECGYRSVATCRVGAFRAGDDPFLLPRIEIRRGLSIDGFRATFRASKVRQLQLLEFGKSCLRRSVGLSNYTRLRRLAHRCLAIHR